MIELKPIEGSSQLAAYAYDHATATLSMRFHKSAFVYQYHDVEPDTVAEFEAAENKGAFFGSRIKGRFNFVPIDTAAGEDAAPEPKVLAQAGFSRMGTLVTLLLASLVFAFAAHAQNTVTPSTATLFRGSTNLGTSPDYTACLNAAGVQTAGTNYQCRVNVAVTAPPPPPPPPPPTGTLTGLDFPPNGGAWIDYSFRFTGAALMPMQPATYIWNVMPRQQTGYYATFFWGFGDGSFTGSNQYYGAHPYPNGGPGGNTHKWEVSTNGQDFTTDANGNDTTVQYGRWYTQALVVAPSGSNTTLTFYWDLPNTAKRINVTVNGGVSPPSSPALVFGASPWAYYNERLNGVLRGVRLYSASLSQADILSEADAPLSTSAGTAGVWYMNLNPTPSDISDKSGRGHNPAWSSSARPALWQQ
jgi:hypothetical protein